MSYSKTFSTAIHGFIADHGISQRRFGQQALCDPGFLSSLKRGRSPRLETTDRVLAFMSYRPVSPVFLREIELFVDVTRTKPSIFGIEAAGDTAFLCRIRRGLSVRLGTADHVRLWMARNSSRADQETVGRLLAEGGNPGKRAPSRALALPPLTELAR